MLSLHLRPPHSFSLLVCFLQIGFHRVIRALTFFDVPLIGSNDMMFRYLPLLRRALEALSLVDRYQDGAFAIRSSTYI